MKITRRSALAASAATAATAAIAGCGSSSGGGGGGEGDDVSLTVATFNEFGYEELFAKYEEENPGVKITHKKAATSDDARANLMTGLAANSGLADVEGVEVGWWAELAAVLGHLRGPHRPRRSRAAGSTGRPRPPRSTASSSATAPTSVPRLIAYRGGSLREEPSCPPTAPSSPRSSAGDWRHLLRGWSARSSRTPASRGSTVPAAPTTGWSSSCTNPYEKADGTLVPLADNTDVKAIYDHLVEYADISAGFNQWYEDWTAAFQNDGFATMLLPALDDGPAGRQRRRRRGLGHRRRLPRRRRQLGRLLPGRPLPGREHRGGEEARCVAHRARAADRAFQAVGAFPSQVDGPRRRRRHQRRQPLLQRRTRRRDLLRARHLDRSPAVPWGRTSSSSTRSSPMPSPVGTSTARTPRESWEQAPDRLRRARPDLSASADRCDGRSSSLRGAAARRELLPKGTSVTTTIRPSTHPPPPRTGPHDVPSSPGSMPC